MQVSSDETPIPDARSFDAASVRFSGFRNGNGSQPRMRAAGSGCDKQADDGIMPDRMAATQDKAGVKMDGEGAIGQRLHA